MPYALCVYSGLRAEQGRVVHDINMQAGTRQMSAAKITMHDAKSGEQIELLLEPRLLFRMKGIGYQHPPVGPLALENIHIQQVVTARRRDRVGHGVLEQLHIGPWAPAGFTDWFDGAA